MRDFRFNQTQWRVLRSLTEVMLPCEGLPEGLSDSVVTRLEYLLRQSAGLTRIGFRFALFFIEYCSGLLFLEWGRFSRIELSAARQRFERLSHHRIGLLVLLAKLLKSLIQIAIYSDGRVERHFGNERRAWRKNRFEFRESLLQISAGKSRPSTPAPLADKNVVPPETYLAWDEGKSS